MIWSIISWCVFGLVIGALARLLMPGDDPMGCFATIGLGVAGSVIGGLLGSLIDGNIGAWEPSGFIGALLGALLLLFLLRRFGGRRT